MSWTIVVNCTNWYWFIKRREETRWFNGLIGEIEFKKTSQNKVR